MARVVERGNGRANLRKKTALNFVGDFEFLGGAAFKFEFGRGRAALGFEGVGNFVEADQRKRAAVGIAKARRDAAPDRVFLTEERGLVRVVCLAGFRVEFDAAETRGVLEADAAARPFLIFDEDVFGDEGDAGRAADKFEVEGVGFGDDEREDGLAVGRSDGDEAFAGLKLGVVGEVEAELVDVEPEAAVLVADVDIDGVDAEVGMGPRGWCGSGHGEIIRGDAREEKDYAGTLRSSGGRMPFALKNVYRERSISLAIIRTVSEFD